MSWSEHVHPHEPMTEVVPGLWQVTGHIPRNPLTRNMAIWRVPGGICIHSGVALEEEAMAEVEALGAPKVLIVPNGFHRMDAAVFKERYPEIQVVAPRAARAKVEQVVPVDADAEDALPSLGVECLAPGGLKPSELIYRVPVDGGRHALVVTDALFNHDHVPGIGGFVLRHITASTGHFGISRLGRWLILQDGPAYASFLRGLAGEEGLAAISVGHGHAITDDPALALREAADRV